MIEGNHSQVGSPGSGGGVSGLGQRAMDPLESSQLSCSVDSPWPLMLGHWAAVLGLGSDWLGVCERLLSSGISPMGPPLLTLPRIPRHTKKKGIIIIRYCNSHFFNYCYYIAHACVHTHTHTHE